jgi:polyphosphate kinase 2 (PPK2 family)
VRGGLPVERVVERFGHLNDFERMLVDEGTEVLKLFLHLSKDEQRERLQARLDDPAKRWKFRRGDLDDRARWDEFGAAYEEAITATSTAHAPWIVVPADRKWLRDVVVATALVDLLERMAPVIPPGEPGLEDLIVE